MFKIRGRFKIDNSDVWDDEAECYFDKSDCVDMLNEYQHTCEVLQGRVEHLKKEKNESYVENLERERDALIKKLDEFRRGLGTIRIIYDGLIK